jgi:hypothetical protein
MIKIEVRIRRLLGEVGTEHEYRAELPDSATAEQIAAVGSEAFQIIEKPDETPQEGSIHIGKPRGVI